MTYIASKKLKYFGLISAFSLFVIMSSLAILRVYTASYDNYNDILVRQNQIEYLTIETQYVFKKQVQEWKNILLRGEDKEDFDRYHESFIAEFENTQVLADTLKQKISPLVRCLPAH